MKHFPREYTGLERTPSSMAWLLKQRASIRGRIEHKTEQRATLQAEINVLRQRLSAVDRVIRQHEVLVDPEEVHGRRSKRKSLVGYGHMGRFVLEQFREADGQALSTTEIAIRFLKSIGQEVTMLNLKDARKRMADRLRDMATAGDLEPRHQPDERGVFKEGLWALRTTDD